MLPHSVSADFTGQIYFARQVLTETTTFHDCTFRDCHTSISGGAVYVDDSSLRVGLSGCLFARCHSFGDDVGPAAIDADPVLSFSLNDTTSLNCSVECDSFAQSCSSRAGSFCLVESESIDISGCATTLCTHDFAATLWLACPFASVDSMNSSANRVSEYASGLFADCNVSLRLCVLSPDGPANCLTFAVSSTISCVSLFNNSCRSYWIHSDFCLRLQH
jgi:hypothetical protein